MINIRKTIFLILLCQSLTTHSFSLAGESKIAPWIIYTGASAFLASAYSGIKNMSFSFVDPFYDCKVNIDDDINPKNKKFLNASKIVAVAINGAFYYGAKYAVHAFMQSLNQNATSTLFEKKDILVLGIAGYKTYLAIKNARENGYFAVYWFETHKDQILKAHQNNFKEDNFEYEYFVCTNAPYIGPWEASTLPLAAMHAMNNHKPFDMLPKDRNSFYDLCDLYLDKDIAKSERCQELVKRVKDRCAARAGM